MWTSALAELQSKGSPAKLLIILMGGAERQLLALFTHYPNMPTSAQGIRTGLYYQSSLPDSPELKDVIQHP